MARSARIYIIKHNTLSVPLAAFTVKHEAVKFIEKYTGDLDCLSLYSVPDGSKTNYDNVLYYNLDGTKRISI